MPVDKIGIEEYKHFLTTCRIQETAAATELPAVRSRFDIISNRRSQLKSLDNSPALTGAESRAGGGKFGNGDMKSKTGRDFFARRSMHDGNKSVKCNSALKSLEAPSPGVGSQFTSYGGS